MKYITLRALHVHLTSSHFYSIGATLLCWDAMHLKILGHPIFTKLNFHMPMIVDLSHPLIILQGENGAGKSTLLHAIFYALRGDHHVLRPTAAAKPAADNMLM